MRQASAVFKGRRRFTLGALAAATLAAAPGLRAATRRFDALLGFQAHAVRVFLQRDFDGTLRTLRRVGYSSIELGSFPGFAGNLHGDFGALADEPPRGIAQRIAAAGLRCQASHFVPKQLFDAEALSAAMSWAHDLGLKWIVLSGLAAFQTRQDISLGIERLKGAARGVKQAGFRFALHTDQTQWATIDGRLIIEHLLDRMPAESMAFELDLGGPVAFGIDPATLLNRYPGRFQAIHLRDGRRPTDPTQYVPASLPGEGVLNWSQLLIAARTAGVRDYVVEMETHSGHELDDTERAYDAFRACTW